MKVLTSQQIRCVDLFTIENEPIASIDLMERAAEQLFLWIQKRYFLRPFVFFVGPGNNGGDGLALARMLFEVGQEVEVVLLVNDNSLSPDCAVNFERLNQLSINVRVLDLISFDNFPRLNQETVVVDAIFGSGLNRPVEEGIAEVICRINASSCEVIAIDVVSGLLAEGTVMNLDVPIVKANVTLAFQLPKLSFFFQGSCAFLGEWYLLNIGLHPVGIQKETTSYYFVTKQKVKGMIRRREKFDHKGVFGHALLVAGSYGKIGAAVLAAKGCLKSGVGLLTAHIPHWGCQVMQVSVPEAMVNVDRSELIFTEFPKLDSYSAIGIGPGIGTKPESVIALKKLLADILSKKIVIDADGLNILAEKKSLLKLVPEQAVLTPHPKEFERLAGSWSNDFERLQLLRDFSISNKVVVVLKGAFTTICTSKGECFFNSTGNPGMATAGSGDVLTGIILALLAQGYSSVEAAILGVYVHGMAGDLVEKDEGMEGLIAGEIINYIGKAFRLIHN